MPFIGKQSTSNSQITNYTTTVGSGGQTNFTVVIEGGDETHVYLNGVLLKETTDYTVSSTQVSLVSPAVENDIVEIKVFRSFALVDAVKGTGDTMTGELEVPTVKLSSNVIKASDGGSTITLDTSDNVTITGIIKTDDIQEKTSAHGVEIDGVLVKDGDVGLATISSKAGTSIGVTLGTDSGDDFNVGSGKLVVKGDSGNVGLGTASPDMPFHVYSSANSLMHIQSTDQDALLKLSDSGGHFQINTANNNTSLGTNGRGEMMRFTGTTGIIFNEDGLDQDFRVESDNNSNALTMNGSSGIWGIGVSPGTYALKIDGVGNSGLFTGGVVSCGSLDNRSDERLKENITPLGDSLNTLNQLRPVTFNLTKDVFAGEDFAGFIAQEVKTVFPIAVRGNENETEDVLNEDGEVTQRPVYMGIKMMEMIALLTKSIQELSAKVTALENATN